MTKCPVYLQNKCVLSSFVGSEKLSDVFHVPLKIIQTRKSCEGDTQKCLYSPYVEPIVKQPYSTKVTIHKVENPYKVKADILIYPTNNVLTIDDPLLHRMSRGLIQKELDAFSKPIKMGQVYVTGNGGNSSLVQSKKIFHTIVAGESRLVNEEDIKTATRKALMLADNGENLNVLMIPADCGTHDINDVARVQLAAIKTYLQSNKNCSIKNIFVVMEDQESIDTFNEYFKRIFK